jgi:hypothetical protein
MRFPDNTGAIYLMEPLDARHTVRENNAVVNSNVENQSQSIHSQVSSAGRICKRVTQCVHLPAHPRIGKAAAVARGHFDIGKQMMTQGDRLCGLQVGEAGHYGRGVLERLFGERSLIGDQSGIECVDAVAHPQPEIGGHLVIARARRVQPARGRPDQLGEPAFDVHVNVFQRALDIELAALDL